MATRAFDWRLVNHHGPRLLASRTLTKPSVADLAVRKSAPQTETAGITAMQQPPELAKNAPCAGASDGHDEHPFVRCNREAPAGSFMIGLVLVTHGRLAVEFRAALEHVVGPQG